MTKYTTVEDLESAFQSALAELPPAARTAVLQRIDNIVVTDEELDQFERDHPGFSAEVMRLARERRREP